MWRSRQRVIAGERLAWRRAGSGPAVMWLHDGGARTRGAPMLDDLAADHDVVVPWLPGYGPSTPPPPDATPPGIGARIATLIDALGWPSATVAGASLGAWFALEAALAAPERVSALVLCDAAGLHMPPDHLMALYVGGHAAGEGDEGLAAALAAPLPPGERDAARLAPALATAVLAPFVQPAAAAAGAAWHPALADPRALARLQAVGCPATLLWGARDPLIPVAHGRAMADALPRGHLRVLAGVGHLPPLEAPQAVADAVRAAAAPGPTAAGHRPAVTAAAR